MRAHTSSLINVANGQVLSGAINGIEMDICGEVYAIIFNQEKASDHHSFCFKLKASHATVYMTGLKTEQSYLIKTCKHQGEYTKVTITENNEGIAIANSNGVMTFTL